MVDLFFLYDLLYTSFSSFKTEYIYGNYYRFQPQILFSQFQITHILSHISRGDLPAPRKTWNITPPAMAIRLLMMNKKDVSILSYR